MKRTSHHALHVTPTLTPFLPIDVWLLIGDLLRDADRHRRRDAWDPLLALARSCRALTALLISDLGDYWSIDWCGLCDLYVGVARCSGHNAYTDCRIPLKAIDAASFADGPVPASTYLCGECAQHYCTRCGKPNCGCDHDAQYCPGCDGTFCSSCRCNIEFTDDYCDECAVRAGFAGLPPHAIGDDDDESETE